MSKIFKGRPVVPGEARAKALVSHEGFNTLASFQKSLLAKRPRRSAPIRTTPIYTAR